MEDRGWARLYPNFTTDFDEVLQDVRYVLISFNQVGSSNQQFQIDDIFLDRLPAASLDGAWMNAGSFTATNREAWASVTNAALPLFLRLEK